MQALQVSAPCSKPEGAEQEDQMQAMQQQEPEDSTQKIEGCSLKYEISEL